MRTKSRQGCRRYPRCCGLRLRSEAADGWRGKWDCVTGEGQGVRGMTLSHLKIGGFVVDAYFFYPELHSHAHKPGRWNRRASEAG